MIEFNQSAQCLFCPQRRKIALIMKLTMAASAAIIVALVLFLPGPRDATRIQSVSLKGQNVGTEVNAVRSVDSTVPDAVSKKSANILDAGGKQFRKLQQQLQLLVTASPARLSEAQTLIESRRREVIATKIILLGDEAFSGGSRLESYRNRTLEGLDKELEILSKQEELLSELRALSKDLSFGSQSNQNRGKN